MLDERRLFFMIGDVSGKGVPASLFMAISKVLSKSIALRERAEIGAMLTHANREIARDNPESQYVTVFAGVLDADSGGLDYWIAGHDAPLRVSREVMKLPSAAAGLPLCVLDDSEYQADRVQLLPGDALVLFTDGITEATNSSGGFYGKERLAAAVALVDKSASATALLAAISSDVHAFVAAAEPSDDLALLVIRWLGPAAT